MSIQAVFFDMGGTIETFDYDRDLRLRAVPGMRELLSAAGIELELSDEEFLDTFANRYKSYHSWRKEAKQELPTWKIWTDFILPDYPEFHQPVKSIAEDLIHYYETHFYHRVMRPEMPVVLEAIQQMGFKMGVISNVVSTGMVPANLKQYGIERYFDPVILSCVYGRRKPDPSIFIHAAQLAGVPASSCAHIGDRIARDIVGARRAGYGLAIQINHEFNPPEEVPGYQPDAVLQNMTELLDVLDAERKRTARSGTNHTRPVRAILFDAGDILYYRSRRGKMVAAFLEEIGIKPPKGAAEQAKLAADRAYRGQLTQEKYHETLLKIYGVTQPEQIERGKRVLEAENGDVEYFPYIPETLRALKEMGYLLGIITDTATPVYVKLEWFERGGFGDVWDTIISSAEMRVRKPDPLIYQAALTQLGIHAHEAVFVGHKTSELMGARNVGMKTVAFNYDPDATADCMIQQFNELLTVPFIANGNGHSSEPMSSNRYD